MFNFHKDHKSLINTALAGFVTLSVIIAILPAFQMQNVRPLPNQQEMDEQVKEGLSIYISEGCVACHTQQVRSIEMDKIWGDRPSMPSDYYYSKQRLDFWRQSPSLLGSERTGPDLTNIGNRQPGKDWHLLHLYNPRLVVKESIMPSYPWLFIEKDTANLAEDDIIVPVGKEFFNQPGKKVTASKEVLKLVAYLQSLKQTPLPGTKTVDFIPSSGKKEAGVKTTAEGTGLPDGEQLYLNTCAACHQPNGEGLPGAFPPLAGSEIVTDPDPERLISIILQGYDAREEYAVMNGFADQLKDNEIAAIANHERSSWGNKARAITEEEVKKIRELVMNK